MPVDTQEVRRFYLFGLCILAVLGFASSTEDGSYDLVLHYDGECVNPHIPSGEAGIPDSDWGWYTADTVPRLSNLMPEDFPGHLEVVGDKAVFFGPEGMELRYKRVAKEYTYQGCRIDRVASDPPGTGAPRNDSSD